MPHKNKTLTVALALVLGGFGIHRFYLKGANDLWAWLHLLSIPLTGALIAAFPDQAILFTAFPFVLSALIADLEGLVLGLTPDEKWDQRYNSGSVKKSNSGSLLAICLVITMATGFTLLLSSIARLFDLMLTGGAYG